MLGGGKNKNISFSLCNAIRKHFGDYNLENYEIIGTKLVNYITGMRDKAFLITRDPPKKEKRNDSHLNILENNFKASLKWFTWMMWHNSLALVWFNPKASKKIQ